MILRLALLFALAVLPGRGFAEDDRPGTFDFYVLALSWSPSYCASVGPGRSPLQCDSGLSFGFILHGLWPQHEEGYPAHCQSAEAKPSQRLVSSLLDIMPSEGLVRHQWRKHGQCSGLSAEDFFALSREVFEAVVIPEAYQDPDRRIQAPSWELEAAFLAANPDLRADMISLVCSAQGLREVRICFDKDKQPRSCPSLEARDCRRRDLTVLPVGG